MYLLFGGGQGSTLHSLVSTGFPGHVLPPYIGMGFTQTRVLDVTPPPQECEHSVQLDQDENPPSTTKNEKSSHKYDKGTSSLLTEHVLISITGSVLSSCFIISFPLTTHYNFETQEKL